MTPNFHSRKPHRFAFILFILFALCISGTAFGKRHSSGRSARAHRGRKASTSARGRHSRGDRYSARAARRGRGGRLSARDVRRQRAITAREQASALKAMERKLHRPLTKRERAAALRGVEARNRRALAEARRRAEAARRAAIARQLAIDNAMRQQVQSFIAKDDLSGEDPEVRRVALNALGNHAGTVVVMDPITGRVYSVVNQEWALHRGFKPCSTIKLVTGVAGLSENVIPPVDTANDGYNMDLTSALAHSKNPQRFLCRLDRSMCSQQDHYDRRVVSEQVLQQLDPIHARHLQIGQSEIEAPFFRKLQRGFSRRGRGHVVAFSRQNQFEDFSLRLLVVNYQDALSCHVPSL